MGKGIFDLISNLGHNLKKPKLKKFRLLSSLIDNIQRMKINLERFETQYKQIYVPTC